MKKAMILMVSCAVLVSFVSCKTTRGTVPAQSAVVEGAEVTPDPNAGFSK